VPNTTNNTWIDATFIEDEQNTQDVDVQLKIAEPDIIGKYSIPIIYKQVEVVQDSVNTNFSYFQELNTISGIINTASSYKVFDQIEKINNVFCTLTEFSLDSTLSGALDRPIIYTTGYNQVSGTLDRHMIFTGGREMFDSISINNSSQYKLSKNISEDWWVNYIDFSGNLTTSGTPIPFHNFDYGIITEYGYDYYNFYNDCRDSMVDISFAGWIGVGITADIYSAISGFNSGYKSEVKIIDGDVRAHYLDIISSDLGIKSLRNNLYCSEINNINLNSEIETIPGRIGYIQTDIYSSIQANRSITMDIDLLSLKITNFSLGIGECTTASGFISVDVIDDECPISISGTTFLLDGIEVPVFFSSIEDGYRVFYNPEDNFSSIEGPVVLTIHAENECGKVLEQDLYLTFGYIVEYINYQDLPDSIDFNFNKKIVVRVTAENYASCPQVSAIVWDFTSKPQSNTDLSASIVGRFHAWENSDMSAKIYPHSTAYFYGKEFKIVVKAKDFAGNQMEPLILNYRIEDKPV
jgi:hypothetical protein